MSSTIPTLDFAHLQSAVQSSAAAFRLTLRLEAVSPKVFPPTYEGGKYATEDRFIDGKPLPCVLLDSVPSQANRMELALQHAWDGGEIQLPVVSTDFRSVDNPGLTKITSLQAPHRIVDAILRDSLQENIKFRDTEIGKELGQLSNDYATPLLQYAPHSLVFGIWDSTGPRGGLGVKFARSIVSEIIGVNAVAGRRTSSRIDPLNIRLQSGVLYQAKAGGWTLDENLAVKDKDKGKEKGKALKLGKDGKPSEANHGNVTPSIADGGFTIEYAEQTTVLSLPALRRLRFPTKPHEKSTLAGDLAARVYLAALGLLGVTLALEAGYDLRSRCLLRAKDAVTWHLLGKPGDADQHFQLDKADAIELYKKALEGVKKEKLPIHLDEIVLTPIADLVTLVKKSIELAAQDTGDE